MMASYFFGVSVGSFVGIHYPNRRPGKLAYAFVLVAAISAATAYYFHV
jgi:hypothetical protein